jgi:hypothetical protein
VIVKKPHVVIRAIAEVKGCSEEVVENFIAQQLAEASSRGDKWTRTGLLNAFKREGSPTAHIITRLESEKKGKKP